MCQEHSMMGQGSMMATAMEEMWELLSEEQKREVAVMRMNKLIKILEIKMSAMEKMIEIKSEAIADIKKIQEMLK
jgi:hypothetical protein